MTNACSEASSLHCLNQKYPVIHKKSCNDFVSALPRRQIAPFARPVEILPVEGRRSANYLNDLRCCRSSEIPGGILWLYIASFWELHFYKLPGSESVIERRDHRRSDAQVPDVNRRIQMMSLGSELCPVLSLHSRALPVFVMNCLTSTGVPFHQSFWPGSRRIA